MSFALLFLALFPCARARAQVERLNVDFDYVSRLASERAKSPFRSPRADLPDVLRQDQLDYDNYRKIRFRHDRDFWAGDNLPFRVEFFHPGYIYQEPVRVFEFAKDFVQRIRFVRDWFDYSGLPIENKVPADTGYAGWKTYFQLNQQGTFDELCSFLGASYFRMLGTGQRYGPSARGLALDCGGAGQPEEFPIFTDFWLEKPAADSKTLHFYALLDSVSCTGAYEFAVTPGATTVADISTVLFFRQADDVLKASKDRKPIETVGWAPLTSMFWFGENSERKFDDYRPEVHDSDGLLMAMATGETLWRPLGNPPVMRHSVFATKDIRGFGLLQRDRVYDHYSDMFNPYHLVPGIWVKPKGDWGEGEVHLVELPTTYEGLDNIVAFWNPKEKPVPMQPVKFGYQLLWTQAGDFEGPENRVVSTRIGPEGRDPKKRQAHIEFDGPSLEALPDGQAPEAVVNCGANARIYETQVVRNPFNKAWRVILKFEPLGTGTDPVDLRCTLKKGADNVSETWVYLWNPPQP